MRTRLLVCIRVQNVAITWPIHFSLSKNTFVALDAAAPYKMLSFSCCTVFDFDILCNLAIAIENLWVTPSDHSEAIIIAKISINEKKMKKNRHFLASAIDRCHGLRSC